MGKVGVDSLDAAITKIMRQYGEEVSDKLKSDLQYAGEFAANEVSRNAQKRTGVYQTAWDYRFKADKDRFVVKVGNSGKHATLSHLLEKGHMTRKGGRWVAGKAHIGPAYDKAVQLLERRLRSG